VLHNLVESARRSARGPLVDEEFSVTGRAADPMELSGRIYKNQDIISAYPPEIFHDWDGKRFGTS
jgi:hypothetical protein